MSEAEEPKYHMGWNRNHMNSVLERKRAQMINTMPLASIHPALPDLARLLNEHPEVVPAARRALQHLTTYGFLPNEEQASMMALVSALGSGRHD